MRNEPAGHVVTETMLACGQTIAFVVAGVVAAGLVACGGFEAVSWAMVVWGRLLHGPWVLALTVWCAVTVTAWSLCVGLKLWQRSYTNAAATFLLLAVCVYGFVVLPAGIVVMPDDSLTTPADFIDAISAVVGVFGVPMGVFAAFVTGMVETCS